MRKATQGATHQDGGHRRAHQGRQGLTVTLEEVAISSYSVSDKTVSWSMSYRKKTFAQTPPKAQPRP